MDSFTLDTTNGGDSEYTTDHLFITGRAGTGKSTLLQTFRTGKLHTDLDGVGNNSDSDDDNDGVADIEDAFPRDRNEFLDTDNDGLGNLRD